MTSDGALGGGMATFRHQGLTFDVRDGGPTEGEVVLLLHGFPQDATSWRHVEPLLHAAGLRTLAPDQRGYSPGAAPSRWRTRRGRGASTSSAMTGVAPSPGRWPPPTPSASRP